MVLPVIFKMTSRSSIILGFGVSTATTVSFSQARYCTPSCPWVFLTQFDIILAHPGHCLHHFAWRITILLSVPSWITHVLLCHGIIAMAQDSLDKVGSLRHRHFCRWRSVGMESGEAALCCLMEWYVFTRRGKQWRLMIQPRKQLPAICYSSMRIRRHHHVMAREQVDHPHPTLT